MDALQQAICNRYQHGMPLCAEPYRAMAEALGCSEAEVIDALLGLQQRGALSRVGPVFEHSRAGASTLVALAVPDNLIEQVAKRINRYPEVNHNYQREHRYNLWFVITGPTREQIDRLLAEIEADTGLRPLDLPMERAYRIDLGFPLAGIAAAGEPVAGNPEAGDPPGKPALVASSAALRGEHP